MIEKNHNYFYKITNLVNGKYYYGIRSCDELPDSRYMGGGTAIIKAIKKYGRENFLKEIIIDYPTRKEASDHEARVVTIELIQLEECYNCRTGGDNEYVHIVTDETRAKLSKAGKGSKRSQETKQRMSLASKGKVLSEEHKINIKLSKQFISDGTREKMRESHIGKVQSDELVKKRIESRKNNKNSWHSEEAKRKMGEKNWLKKLKGTEEVSKKMSDMAVKKPCKIEGVVFNSIVEAARYFKVIPLTIIRRIKYTSDKFKDWNYYNGDEV